jgi:hypothetical protein
MEARSPFLVEHSNRAVIGKEDEHTKTQNKINHRRFPSGSPLYDRKPTILTASGAGQAGNAVQYEHGSI